VSCIDFLEVFIFVISAGCSATLISIELFPNSRNPYSYINFIQYLFCRATNCGSTSMVRSAIGAATIVVGFYAVVWGQAQEKKMVEDCPTSSHESSSPRVPLLHNKSTRV
jgi:hypothetical protein